MVSELRSQRWLEGTDEVAMLHRAALRSSGIDLADGRRPVVGIADSSSPLNPCNLPLRDLLPHVAAGVVEAGGIPVPFPVMSLGEDLMKPTAMLYRNLLSMEVEEYLRSYPLDGVVLLANCDKSIPGALMGAISADLPTMVVTAGPRPPASYRGVDVGAGTDVWRMLAERQSGNLSDDDWEDFEACLSCSRGACNVMGTACTMALLVEFLGLSMPGSSLIESGTAERAESAHQSGRALVDAIRQGRVPSTFLTRRAYANAVKLLHGLGGSTNAVIHLLALAGRSGVPLSLADFDVLGRDVPLIADVEPSGTKLISALQSDGGLRAVLFELQGKLDLTHTAGDGKAWSDHVYPAVARHAIRMEADALSAGGCFAVVSGNLAPRGALIKTSAASPDLMQHQGPALVFTDYHQMRRSLADANFEVAPETVLVFAGAGPVGGPGMPEWGMMPIPAYLASRGVRDMVRVTDARMSGTSYGTCVLHVSPEAAIGGPLSLVRTGDTVLLDVPNRLLRLVVDDAVLQDRKRQSPVQEAPAERGWPSLYRRHVGQADEGCDFDFLRTPLGAVPVLVEPTIGRS